MRLFTALDLPAETRSRLELLLSELRLEAPIHWSPIENLHITTKFIGEWPESRVDEMGNALARLSQRLPFEVEVHDLGWFPHANSPKVLWAGVDGGNQLNRLATSTEECVAKLGVARETRPFSPHLTLARIKNPAALESLRARVESLKPATFGSFTATGFYLYRSEAGSNASVYQKLRSYQFESAGSIKQTK